MGIRTEWQADADDISFEITLPYLRSQLAGREREMESLLHALTTRWNVPDRTRRWWRERWVWAFRSARELRADIAAWPPERSAGNTARQREIEETAHAA